MSSFYKLSLCVELKTFFIVRQVKPFFFLWKTCLLVVPVGFDPRFNVTQGRYILTVLKNNMFIFQGQQNPMEILSGMHGGFRITKPSKFSGVQKILKLWLTIITINFRAYLTIFPTEKTKILFVISYFIKITFNWVQPRLDFFLENENKKQKQKKQQMFY